MPLNTDEMTEQQTKRLLWITLFLFLSIVPTVLLSAVVLTHLWAWFVVPLGVKPIGIAWALGLSSVVSYMTYHKTYVDIKDEQRLRTMGMTNDEQLDRLFSMLMWMWGRPMLAFIFGAVYHYFM